MGNALGKRFHLVVLGLPADVRLYPRATPSGTGEPRVSSGLAWRDKQSTGSRGLNNKMKKSNIKDR